MNSHHDPQSPFFSDEKTKAQVAEVTFQRSHKYLMMKLYTGVGADSSQPHDFVLKIHENYLNLFFEGTKHKLYGWDCVAVTVAQYKL